MIAKRERKRWAYDVCMELERKGIKYTEKAVFLCGINYRKYLEMKFIDHEIPLKGLGMGRQIQFLKRRTSDIKK